MKYFYEKNIEIENIAVVGDQIFTDILGANRMKLYPILVEPIIVEKDYLITKIKRPIEKKILEKWQKQNENRRD